MEINLVKINSQSKQLREQAINLRNVRSLLLQYQDNLCAHWKGEDIKPINSAINTYVEKITSIATDLELISSSVISEAKKLKIAEDEKNGGN